MPRRRLLWQLFFSFFFITPATLVAIIWFVSQSMSRFYFEQRESDLLARACLIERQLAAIIPAGEYAEIDSLCKDLGRATGTRITVILSSGQVVGDTDEDPARMDNHAQRPEVAEALLGNKGMSIRYSMTVQRKMMYVAIPLTADGNIQGVVRTSLPVMTVREALHGVSDRILLGGLVVAIVVLTAGLWLSRRISRPLERIKSGAAEFARGNLRYRLAVPDSEEMAELARAMNDMAAQLDERIRAAVRRRNEREAILASMVEGVLAVDVSERVIILNQAAAKLFDVSPEDAQGRTIQEVVRNIELQRLITRTLRERRSVEGTVALPGQEERFLQAHGTLLCDAQGESIGALVVLNDITRIRKLENLRRDFVANVSHELKTPVTSIKGFVETLLDGAVDNPDDARRFLSKTA
ncbi:MAG: HAMP domain-containing protein, partial [Candidatus Zixiibacteriota bacterium]